MAPPLRPPAGRGHGHVTVDAADPLAEVAARLRDAAAGFAVVLRHGKVAGIVTARQLSLRLHDPATRGRGLCAGNIMTFRQAATRSAGLAR